MAKSIQLPPRKGAQPSAAKKAVKPDEKEIQAVISKGGSTTKTATPRQEDTLKNFNVRILESELDAINDLRGKRPKPRGGKRLGVSLHDWIVEAIQEKIDREKRKFTGAD